MTVIKLTQKEKEMVEKIKGIDSIRALQVMETSVGQWLNIEKMFPQRDELGIKQLKREKRLIRCRINQLADDNFNRVKEMANYAK
jgi:hypothetical protein